MIRAILVDDDAEVRGYLRELLAVHSDVEIAAECSNIADAGTSIAQHRPHLLFLDVEMPGGSGFELLRKMGSWPFRVIFTTGFQRYAIQAIRFSALDYLLKPVQPDELAEALQRFRDQQPGMDRLPMQRQFLSNLAQADEKAMKLTLSHGDRTYFISPSEITHCTADDNYTELHVEDGRRFVSARTLKNYEEMLLPMGFLRVHRSSLVNRAMITHLDGMHVVLRNSARVEMSRRKRDEVQRALAG
ncbi:MAG: response regulator transcription factor [Bacteroidetes bacterium]|nr:response regulator transcription factor [Bacteroidota bacterium]